MGETKVSVFGLYSNAALAEQVLDSLTEAGFSSEDVSVVMKAPADRRTSGGTLGLLAGFGALPMANSDPLAAAGPIRHMLEGVSESGAPEARRGLPESLSSLGLTKSDATLYTAKINAGSVLLAVRCGASGDVDNASHTFTSSGAEAVALVRESKNHLESARMSSGR